MYLSHFKLKCNLQNTKKYKFKNFLLKQELYYSSLKILKYLLIYSPTINRVLKYGNSWQLNSLILQLRSGFSVWTPELAERKKKLNI